MRRGREVDVIRDDEGRVVVVSLGADFCAEHEWGIKGLRRAFGIPTEVTRENAGLDYRKIRQVPQPSSLGELYVHDFESKAWDRSKKKSVPVKGHALLYYHRVDNPEWSEEYINKIPGELTPYEANFEFSSAWSESDFGLLANSQNPRNVESVDRLLLAFKDLDVAVWLGGGGVFQNAGLCLGIVSRMDQSIFEQWKAVDLDGIALKEAATATGIEEKLKEAGRRYFALSPRWNHEMNGGKSETKHPVMFWLNPMEQDKYSYGWFSVEDLELWAEGKGPVVELRRR